MIRDDIEQHVQRQRAQLKRTLPERGPYYKRLKRAVQFVFGLICMPRLIVMSISAALDGADQAFANSSESIARLPGRRGVFMRQAFYERTLDYCGRDIYFGWNSVFSMRQARVGNEVFIGRFCSLGFADLHDGAMLADGVQILSGGHEHGIDTSPEQPFRWQEQVYSQVRIGAGAWIGAGAVVMADVGECAIVGAGSVVTRPIPPYCVAVGAPARVVRRIGEPSSSAEALLDIDKPYNSLRNSNGTM